MVVSEDTQEIARIEVGRMLFANPDNIGNFAN